MTEIKKFISSLNIQNKYVIVAVSGGPDSMYLLNLLISLKEKLNIKIVVAHVHHNLRKESDEEALNLKKYCNLNNIIFEMTKIEKYPNNKFSEEYAREFRYNFFDSLVKKYNSDILFTAHHGDDLIETIMMRIIRGSTLKGYAGFEKISTDRGYKIVRPLINMTKEEIERELSINNINYAVDKSNFNLKYTRNRIRSVILPELKKENETIQYKFSQFSEKILMANNFINSTVNNIYGDIVKDEIDISKFNKLDKVLKISILERYLKEIYNSDITLINDKHIDLIINKLLINTSIVFNLPLKYVGIIEYETFKIVPSFTKDDYEYTFFDKIKLPNGHTIEIDNLTNITNNYVIHLNSKEIAMPFHVRTKRDGDYMTVKNMLGHQNVNNIYTNYKLPKELRCNYPIVTDDSGKILWIPGIKKSDFDRKKDKKYDIILKYN